jgi:DNA-binding HxlR family transcriptional regulator
MSEFAMVSDDARQVVDAWEDVIVRTLASFDDPVTVSTLRHKLPGPYQCDEAELQRRLDDLIAQGLAYRFKPYRGKADRYWNRSPRDYAAAILTSQTVGRFATKNALVTQFGKRLKELNAKELGDLIQQLVRSGKLHTGQFLGGRSPRYSASPVDARALLENAIEQIARRFSMPVGHVKSLLAETELSPSTDAEPTPDSLVMEAIAELGRDRDGQIIPIAELRRFLEFKLGRDTFNATLRDMERRGLVDFTVHPDPGSLGEAGRIDRMLTEGGKVYDMLIVRR